MPLNRKYLTALLVTHPFLSIITPFLLLQAIHSIIQSFFPGAMFIMPLQWVVIFLIGVVKVAFNKLYQRERLHNLYLIREFIILAFFLYLVQSLVQGKPVAASFYPVPGNMYPFILGCVQWIFTWLVHSSLGGRERFLAAVSAEHMSGAPLRQYLKNGNFDLAEATANLEKIKHVQRVLFGVFLAFLFAAWMFQTPSDPGRFAAALAFLSAFVISRMLVNLFQREQHFYWEGIATSAVGYGKRVLFALFILAACSVIALLMASGTPILDLSRFQLRLPLPSRDWEAYFQPDTNRSDPIRETLDRMSRAWESPVTPFLRIIWIMIAVLGCGALLFFLVAPFLSRNFRQYLKTRHPLQSIRRGLEKVVRFFPLLFRQLQSLIGALFSRTLRRKRKKRKGVKTLQKKIGKPPGDTPSLGKRLQTDRIIRAFYRVMRWGGRHRLPYAYGQTAIEYAAKLIAHFPAGAEDLQLIVAAFEHALFSRHTLEKTEVHHYMQAVRRVLKLGNRDRLSPAAAHMPSPG